MIEAPSSPVAIAARPPSARQAVMRLENISRVFYTDDVETHALSGVTLSIEPGEFVAISGPSGCGKSTLLSIMGLLDRPSAGEFHLNGQSINQLSYRERVKARSRQIGFIFQSFNLIGDLTSFQNVELPLLYQGLGSAERRKRANEALERVQMSERANHYPNQLSGGQQQRVAVARALATSPDILLADEPTGNLDSKNGHRVMELLKALNNEGRTICMVTHDERHTAFAKRVVHLFDGKVVDETEKA